MINDKTNPVTYMLLAQIKYNKDQYSEAMKLVNAGLNYGVDPELFNIKGDILNELEYVPEALSSY